jgi:hypothetical protein
VHSNVLSLLELLRFLALKDELLRLAEYRSWADPHALSLVEYPELK